MTKCPPPPPPGGEGVLAHCPGGRPGGQNHKSSGDLPGGTPGFVRLMVCLWEGDTCGLRPGSAAGGRGRAALEGGEGVAPNSDCQLRTKGP